MLNSKVINDKTNEPQFNLFYVIGNVATPSRFTLQTGSWVNYNLRQVGLLKNIIGTNKTRTHNRKLNFI